jgi:hypothetical protein
VTVHGEERGEVGKEEKRRKKKVPFLSMRCGLGSSWIPRVPPSLAPFYAPRTPGWLVPYAKVQMWKKFFWGYICEKCFIEGPK